MARKITVLNLLIFILPLFILSACSSVDIRKELGLNAQSPDEFSVIKREPLEFPPSFEQGQIVLPKPTPGKERPQKITAQEKAQELFTHVSKEETPEPSQLDEKQLNNVDNFLENIDTSTTSTNIRETLEKEHDEWLTENISVVEKLGIKGNKKLKEQALDPEQETERLKTLEDVLNVVSPK